MPQNVSLVDLGFRLRAYHTNLCPQLKTIWPTVSSLWVLTLSIIADSSQGWTWDNQSSHRVAEFFINISTSMTYFSVLFLLLPRRPSSLSVFRVAAWIHPIKAWRCSWWPLANRTCRRFCSVPSPRTRKLLSFSNPHTQSSLPTLNFTNRPLAYS